MYGGERSVLVMRGKVSVSYERKGQCYERKVSVMRGKVSVMKCKKAKLLLKKHHT